MRNAFAAWLYNSAAFSHFSCRPPKRLKPPEAPATALSALGNGQYEAYRVADGGVGTFCIRVRGSCAMIAIFCVVFFCAIYVSGKILSINEFDQEL